MEIAADTAVRSARCGAHGDTTGRHVGRAFMNDVNSYSPGSSETLRGAAAHDCRFSAA
jgi:hypothetical protein